LFAWGENAAGNLGLGNRTNYSAPVQVGSLTAWSSISSFGREGKHTLSVKTDGTLWSWGQNANGQLGLGNRTNYSSPKQVGALTNWLKVAVAYRTSFAIKTDGSLWSWGGDVQGFGILGHGVAFSYYSSPKQVGSLTNWAEIASGFRQTVAVKTDGTFWSWGHAYFGSLGLGNRTNYSSPKQVGSLTTWLKVSCGYAGVHAITTGGALWAWGDNISGQLGLGNTTYSFSSPQQVGSLTNWSFICNGTGGNRGYSLALKTDGTMWSWGPGTDGRLGLGNTTNYSSPVQIGALTSWYAVAAGNFQSIASKTNGTLWTWGNNAYGQLGLDNRTYYSSPKQVGLSTTWLNVAAGQDYMVARG
jgi:alpha-tubulin suppressor-like RCC1 family protein